MSFPVFRQLVSSPFWLGLLATPLFAQSKTIDERKLQVREIHTTRVCSGTVTALAFSKGDRYLACGSDNGKVVIYEVGTRQCIAERNFGPIHHLEWLQDGRRLAVGSFELSIWDVLENKRNRLRVLPTPGLKRVRSQTPCEVSRDGQWLAWSPEVGVIQIVDTKTWTAQVTRRVSTEVITSVELSPDGTRVGACVRRGHAIIWSLSVDTVEEVAQDKPQQHTALSFLPKGEIAVASEEPSAVTFGNKQWTFLHPVRAMQWSADGSVCAVSNGGTRVVLSHLADKPRKTVHHPNPRGQSGQGTFALSNSGDLLATASRDSQVIIWKNGQSVAELPANLVHVDGLAFSADGKILALQTPTSNRLWTPATNSHRALPGYGVVTTGRSGSQVASFTGAKIEFIDSSTGKTTAIKSGLDEGLMSLTIPTALSFSPDGRRALVSTTDTWLGTTSGILEIESGVFTGYDTVQYATDVAWSPDSSIYSAVLEGGACSPRIIPAYGELRVADMNGVVHSPPGFAYSSSFSHDGSKLYWCDGKALYERHLERQATRTHKATATFFRVLGPRLAISHNTTAVTFWDLDELKPIGTTAIQAETRLLATKPAGQDNAPPDDVPLIRAAVLSPDRQRIALCGYGFVKVFEIVH